VCSSNQDCGENGDCDEASGFCILHEVRLEFRPDLGGMPLSNGRLAVGGSDGTPGLLVAFVGRRPFRVEAIPRFAGLGPGSIAADALGRVLHASPAAGSPVFVLLPSGLTEIGLNSLAGRGYTDITWAGTGEDFVAAGTDSIVHRFTAGDATACPMTTVGPEAERIAPFLDEGNEQQGFVWSVPSASEAGFVWLPSSGCGSVATAVAGSFGNFRSPRAIVSKVNHVYTIAQSGSGQHFVLGWSMLMDGKGQVPTALLPQVPTLEPLGLVASSSNVYFPHPNGGISRCTTDLARCQTLFEDRFASGGPTTGLLNMALDEGNEQLYVASHVSGTGRLACIDLNLLAQPR
jgi:hypothetical protein